MSDFQATVRAEGFTLVETLVASFGVAVGCAGLLVSLSALSRTATLTSLESQALHRARQRVKELRMLSFADPELTEGTHIIPGGRCIVSAYTYPSTRQVAVSQDVVAPNSSTSQVTVSTVFTSLLHK